LATGDTKGIPDDRLKQIGVAASAALAVLPQAAHVLSQQYAAEAAPALGQPVLFFEASPRLAIATIGRADGVAAPSGNTVSLDLRRNSLRAVGRDVGSASVIAANIARGVLDGAIEDALVSGDTPVVSTVGVLAEARTKDVAVSASAAASAQTVGWSDDARARIRSDDTPSAVVVAPAGAVRIGGASRAAWWRVDTATGETIGEIDPGLNGAMGPEAAFLYEVMLAYFVISQVVVLGLTVGGVGGVVVRAAVAFVKAAGPGAAGAAQKGWDAAKKTW
jgi:hypothetical protein